MARLARGTNHTFASKPALYRGHHMRSRTEVRWAVFFDALGAPWQYEPRMFRTSEGGYLPDFLVGKTHQWWLEIKGPEPVERDYVRAAHVVRVTGQKFRFLVGPVPPGPTHGVLRTRILQGRTWRQADWQTPWGAARTDAALAKANAYRFDDLL